MDTMRSYAEIEQVDNRKKMKELEKLLQLNDAKSKKFGRMLQQEKVANEKLK